jgi:hypothetical protein
MTQSAIRNPQSATERTASGCHLPVKRGKANHRYRPIGSLRILTHGRRKYVFIKVRDDGPFNSRWRSLAAVVWERNHGPLPAGMVLWHRDRNSLDCRPENLEPVTRLERLRRNIAANADRCKAIWRAQAAERQPHAVMVHCVNAARRRKLLAANRLSRRAGSYRLPMDASDG